MKKKMVGIVAVLVMAGVISLLWAQAQTPPAEKPEMKPGGGGMGMMGGMAPGMGMPGGCPMCGMMMHGMMQKQMVATSDGGVIVMAGCSLQKYDANLQLVKEVDLKIDIEKIQKHMQEMKKNCPMCCPMKQPK
jgi:hypothetical protein